MRDARIEDIDKTTRECLRAIRALAGDMAGDVGGEDASPGARCVGHDKLLNSLSECVVKLTSARTEHSILKDRLKKGEGDK